VSLSSLDAHANLIRIKFFVGYSENNMVRDEVRSEMAVHGDVVILKSPDYDGPAAHNIYPSRSATTVKLILAIRYALRLYNFMYFARVGDDTYFKIDVFWWTMKMIERRRTLRKAIIGHITEANLQVCHNQMCRYPSGMGYILTHDVAEWLNVSSNMLHLTWPEDGCVGAWVVGTTVRLIHDERFHDIYGSGPTGKKCRAESIMIHKPSRTHWYSLLNTGVMAC